MRYTKLYLTDFPAFYKKYLQSPKPCYLNLLMPDDGSVVIGLGEGDEAKEVPEGCIVVETRHKGGTIVGFEDGITLFAFTGAGKKRPLWSENLVRLCESKGLTAEYTGNDILVNGYKVAGCTGRQINDKGLMLYTIHISVNMDVGLIERICSKTMVKVPKGLAEYGITRADVMSALEIEE